MSPYRTALLLGLALVAIPDIVAARENRCGWISNPTPGNLWLEDRDGTWILTVQGGPYEPEGMVENFPDISTGDYVETNGNYGYTCGCIQAETEGDPEAQADISGGEAARITVVYAVELLPLARCLDDRSLPAPE